MTREEDRMVIDPLRFSIRALLPTDAPFLYEMLYLALHVPPGVKRFPREIVKSPQLRQYVYNWGNSDDVGFAAVDDLSGGAIGAAWIRLLKGENRGYGYVDDVTPELSVAVLPEYRGHGVGTQLLENLLMAAQSRYPAVCLSVSADNQAFNLYVRSGFGVVAESAVR